MPETYFKAVRPDGSAFHDQSFRWVPESGNPAGTVVTHPTPTDVGAYDAGGYLSVATVATDCTGAQWPCRLLRVEAIGEAWRPDADGARQKVAGHAFRVIEELPAHLALGPQGEHVVALLARIGRMTAEEIERAAAAWDATWAASRAAAWAASRATAWAAAWDASRVAAWDAARYAARDAAWAASRAASRVAARDAARVAARVAAWGAARDAARDAVTALVVRDLLMTSEQGRAHWDALTRPLRLGGVTVHPDDPAVTE